MTPVLRRTWAPCGATPTFAVRARSHEKVSGIGALVVSPRRHRITLALALYPRLNIRGPQVLRFLRHLARHVRGPVILVWDRGNPHKHHLVRAWLATHPRWEIVWFPPYAPELNPVELLWSYLKYGRLANFAPDTVDEIRSHVGRERRRLGRRPQFLRSFFRHSALPFRVQSRTLLTHLSLIEACGLQESPRHLIRDRDRVYGERFSYQARTLAIREAVTAPRSPWQNAYAERVIGSIRRECLDHVVVIGERHPMGILAEYVDYYNRTRTHLSLTKDAPEPRSVQPPSQGRVVEVPRVGGLHHEYLRKAA